MQGVPSITTPFTVDQPSWARYVHAFGVGTAPVPYKALTVERLANTIHEAVTSPATRQRAAEIGNRIRAEDGLGRTIELMHHYQLLPRLLFSTHYVA
jgi:sterol 3beta-glucosyltransferase